MYKIYIVHFIALMSILLSSTFNSLTFVCSGKSFGEKYSLSSPPLPKFSNTYVTAEITYLQYFHYNI